MYIGRILAFKEEMKPTLFSLVFLVSAAQAEMPWIEPPERSKKGHLVPTPDYVPKFPKDHGAHEEYGLEWWYWVGHLKAKNGKGEFGFQSTVFRVAGDPNNQTGQPSIPTFGNKNLYLAHAALSDISNGQYLHYERMYREGWQASSSSQTLDIQVGGIRAYLDTTGSRQHLVTRYPGGATLKLTLNPSKPIISFGDRGLSRKGSAPAAVSWYWSYTRLKAEGTLTYKEEEIPVEGTAWMDHEVSSSQLGKELEGWDWTCIQLNDGNEVKAYRLRQENGGSDPWSAIYWIDAEGKVTKAYGSQFEWIENKEWRSPNTQLAYPTKVTISANHPKKGKVVYRLEPLLADQEFRGLKGDNPYWEGACIVMDETGNEIGRAYLELAGYGGGLGARLN